MKTIIKITTILAILLLLSTSSQAQDGSLDLSFGNNGIVTTMTDSVSGANSVILQTGGKIITAGYTFNGIHVDFALVRYNTDGRLDSTFGSDGIVTTDLGGDNDVINDIVIQSDEKILVAGLSYNLTNNDFALVRYNTDGRLDSTFDSDGIVVTTLGANDIALAIRLQTDNKILLAGGANYIAGTGSGNFALVRYNNDGSLDSSFDTDGIVITPIGSSSYAWDIEIQLDGKILVAGFANNGTNSDFAVVRYNPDGSLDLSFDTDGIVTTPIGSGFDAAFTMSLQSDGKILLAGHSYNGTNSDFAMARYNTNGSLDLNFDIDGKVTTTIGNSYDIAYGISIQSDGKILLAGSSDNGTNSDFAMARYNTNGSLDLSFDADGIVTTPLGSQAEAWAINIQPDGKILLAGYSYLGFTVIRYNNTITSITPIEDNTHRLSIYPNPFKTTTTIEFGTTLNNAELSIYNLFNQKLKTISNISNDKINLNRDELPTGSYLISLTQDKKVIATEKLVITD